MNGFGNRCVGAINEDRLAGAKVIDQGARPPPAAP
jgi:hypothetical protein